MATFENAFQLYNNSVFSAIPNKVTNIAQSFKKLEYTSNRTFNLRILEKARFSLFNINIAASNAANSQNNLNQKIQAGGKAASDMGTKFKNAMKDLGNKTLQTGIQFVTDSISLQNVQNVAETRLGSVMQRQMGANPEEIQRIKDLTSNEQNRGVVRDEVQMSGAQQLAAYLDSSDALATLIPAMNDLAVQQNGLNVSSQDAASIGDMMGKVMQGQVDALSIAGASFSEAQEQIFKYGSEQEKAVALAQFISDHVGNMNAVMAETPQGQIQQLANAWQGVKERVGAELYPAVVQFFSALGANMPMAENLIMGLAGALSVVITWLSYMVTAAGTVAGFFVDNWSWIAPIILGIAAAIAVYNIAMGIGWLATLKTAAATAWKTVCDWAQTAAIIAMTLAQNGLNAAIALCPIFWIILGIMALIGIIFLVVNALNKWKGTTFSVVGVIAGIFGALLAFMANQFVIPLWNMIAEFINFFYNVWNDPVAAVKILFLDLALNVIDQIANMAHAIEQVINGIPGVEIDITSGLDNFRNKVEAAAAKIKTESEWKEIVGRKEYIDLGDAFSSWYDGASTMGKNKGFQPDENNGYEGYGGGVQESWDNINANTGNTANNTAAMANSMDMAEEDLKYLRDVAEQEIINRFTTAELSVSMGGITNQITSQMDLDGIGNYLSGVIYETLETAAEGVY